MPGTGSSVVSARFSLKGARSRTDAQAAAAPARWGQGLDQAAGIYAEALRNATPKGQGQRPGGLRFGWRVRAVSIGGQPGRLIYNAHGYLKVVLEGRGAIDQKATGRSRPLHFWAGGKEFYRWRVGPAKANPFHMQAIKSGRERVRRSLRGTLKSIIVLR